MSTERTDTFSIANGMFGVDRLAKRLNALVTDSRIADWHPGSWIDWDHAVAFGTAERPWRLDTINAEPASLLERTNQKWSTS
jgi:hypothetical protein